MSLLYWFLNIYFIYLCVDISFFVFIYLQEDFDKTYAIKHPRKDTNMERLPKDPIMLYSVINTKLRDFYSSLEALCEDMNIDKNTLKEKLSSAGFEYNKERNQFI